MKASLVVVFFSDVVDIPELTKTLERFAKEQGCPDVESSGQKTRLEFLGVVESWSSHMMMVLNKEREATGK